jgi:PAS domain S-box-containing protein
MVTHSADAMVIVNGSGVIEAVSESGARLLGFEEAELLGKSVEDLTEPYSRIERAVRLQDLQQNSMNPTVSVLRVKTKTGAFQWMSVVVTMIRHRGPGVKALVKLEKLDLAFRNMAAI